MAAELTHKDSGLRSASRAAGSFILLSVNTILCASALFPLALIKLVLPLRAVRRSVDRCLNSIAEHWIAGNCGWIDRANEVDWQLRLPDDLAVDRWYLVTANHQSWVDIFALQYAFNRRIPMLKFLLKKELIWVPVLGLAWWALDFPFMRRHSERFLEQNPERRDDDRRALRKACEKFALIPTSVINFVEGTRFKPAKMEGNGSEYNHLLRPKIGGITLALEAMGELFHSLLDVTIYYPDGVPSFYDLLAGRVRSVVLHVEEHRVPSELRSSEPAAGIDRQKVQQWVTQLWTAKDQRLASLARGDY